MAVTASPDHEVLDRRRIALVEPGLPAAPVHHEGGAHPLHRSGAPPDDDALAALVARVRDSAERMAASALGDIEREVGGSIVSISLRAWPPDFPEHIAVQRRIPYESSADSVMYRKVLADEGRSRGWNVCFYDAKTVEQRARRRLGERADEVLLGPRAVLGPPWNTDHRMALAATVLAPSG